MAIQNRRGLEADFDPDKMLPGEWAVTTDKKYVHMCFSAGVVIRMATYEAFEADMGEIRNILAECQTIEEVVTRINKEVNANAELVVEYTAKAKEYMEQAAAYAKQAETVSGIHIASNDIAGVIKPGENTVDADGTLVLTRKVSGSDIVATDSYAGGLKINKVFGKSVQGENPAPDNPQPIVSAGQKLVDGVVTDVGISKKLTGKNLLKNTAKSQTINGVTFTVNNNKSITISGTNDNTNVSDLYIYGSANDTGNYLNIPKGSIVSFEGIQKTSVELICREKETLTYNLEQLTNLLAERDCRFYGILLRVTNGKSVDTTIYPMIRLASIEDDTWEPYTEQTLTLNHVLRGIPLGTDIPEMFKSNALHMAGIYWNEEEQQYYIGDTEDGVNGVYVQRVNTVTVTGTFNPDADSTNVFRCIDVTVDRPCMAYPPLLCSHFSRGTSYNNVAQSDTSKIAINSAGTILVKITMFGNDEAAELTTWFSENEVKVSYPLATPIETPLTDEEIVAVHQLKTYQGVTHIFGSNDPAPTLEVEYGASRVGALSLENSNLHAVNEVLRWQMEARDEGVQSQINNLNNVVNTLKNTLNYGYAKKNLMVYLYPDSPYPLQGKETITYKGITYTDNGDGTITANGTATDYSFVSISSNGYNSGLLTGNYTLSGCPAGGSETSYNISIFAIKSDGSAVDDYDYGDGVTFEVQEGEYYMESIVLGVRKGTTVTNLVFKPQITIS